MRLQLLIDRMIDQAIEIDPTGSYNILIGNAPVTETDWVTGKMDANPTDESSTVMSRATRSARVLSLRMMIDWMREASPNRDLLPCICACRSTTL